MPQPFSWKNLIDRRVLVAPLDHDGGPREYILREVAPKSGLVKFENNRGKTFWCPDDQYELLEDLGERK